MLRKLEDIDEINITPINGEIHSAHGLKEQYCQAVQFYLKQTTESVQTL